jgi:tRNA (guanine37-N1)-methyltransferase
VLAGGVVGFVVPAEFELPDTPAQPARVRREIAASRDAKMARARGDWVIWQFSQVQQTLGRWMYIVRERLGAGQAVRWDRIGVATFRRLARRRFSQGAASVHANRGIGVPGVHSVAMRFDLITIFPEFFVGPMEHGIVRKAREAGLVEVRVRDLREFTKDRHRTVDDRPFGGGEGMVLKPEPLFLAVEALLGCGVGDATGRTWDPVTAKTAVVLTSAAGRPFRQATARRWAELERVIFICGRYEGVDERVAEHLATDEVSIGDFVLSGGELAACLMVDTLTRLLPGALGNEASSVNESFSATTDDSGRTHVSFGDGARGKTPDAGIGGSRFGEGSGATGNTGEGGLLDFPHYTRPAEFRGWSAPEVLIGGNHAEVAKWRRAAALEKTQRMRPELLLK